MSYAKEFTIPGWVDASFVTRVESFQPDYVSDADGVAALRSTDVGNPSDIAEFVIGVYPTYVGVAVSLKDGNKYLEDCNARLPREAAIKWLEDALALLKQQPAQQEAA
jgi:hypothetical protein